MSWYKRKNWPQLFCVSTVCTVCNLQIYIFILPYHFQLISKCTVCISSIYCHVKYFNKRYNIISIVLWQYYGKVNLYYCIYILCSEIMSIIFSSLINIFYMMKTCGWKIPFVIGYAQILSVKIANFPSSDENPLLSNIYKFVTIHPIILTKISVRHSHSVTTSGSKSQSSSTAFKLSLLWYDGFCVMTRSASAIASHLIPRCVESDGTTEIMEHFVEGNETIDPYNP